MNDTQRADDDRLRLKKGDCFVDEMSPSLVVVNRNYNDIKRNTEINLSVYDAGSDAHPYVSHFSMHVIMFVHSYRYVCTIPDYTAGMDIREYITDPLL